MPSTLKILVLQGRDLPIMDSQTKSTDSYVTIKIGKDDERHRRTETHKQSLDPIWDCDCRIEIANDLMLQDEPLVFA
jgi:Ca2+-dependent lipid-binding protein